MIQPELLNPEEYVDAIAVAKDLLEFQNENLDNEVIYNTLEIVWQIIGEHIC